VLPRAAELDKGRGVELQQAIRKRRMVRAYEPGRGIERASLDRVLDAARRSPSAGNSQGLDLLVLEGPAQTERYWDLTFPDRSDRWIHAGLFDAPVLVVVLVDPSAYTARYGEADKAGTGLHDEAAWPVPYWWVDGGCAAENLLLTAVDEGLGACLFGIFRGEREVLDAFGVPPRKRALGTVSLGHPADDAPGLSSTRRRRPLAEMVHRGSW
jgi:nitroreductase